MLDFSLGVLNVLYRNCDNVRIGDGIVTFEFYRCEDWSELMDSFQQSVSSNLRFVFTVSTDFTLSVSIGIRELLLNYPNRCNYGKS